jgi:hypothetical protein
MKNLRQSKSVISKSGISLTVLLFGIIFETRAQTEEFKDLPQYLFPEFSSCTLKMKAGNNLSILLNYNIVTGKMVFFQKNQVFDLVNPEMIDTAFINTKKFIPAGKVFYEVIMEKPAALFIEHKGKIQEPGKPAAYGGTSQVSSSNYISNLPNNSSVYNLKLPDEYNVKSEQVYWIIINSTKYNFVNERQFAKIFPGKEADIKAFVKKNKLKFENPEDVIKLVFFCCK